MMTDEEIGYVKQIIDERDRLKNANIRIDLLFKTLSDAFDSLVGENKNMKEQLEELHKEKLGLESQLVGARQDLKNLKSKAASPKVVELFSYPIEMQDK